MYDDALDRVAIPQMTLRELLFKVFEDDWNTQKTVAGMSDNDLFSAALRVNVEGVDGRVAKEAYRQFRARQRTM